MPEHPDVSLAWALAAPLITVGRIRECFYRSESEPPPPEVPEELATQLHTDCQVLQVAIDEARASSADSALVDIARSAQMRLDHLDSLIAGSIVDYAMLVLHIEQDCDEIVGRVRRYRKTLVLA
jgi:hypothetical protein